MSSEESHTMVPTLTRFGRAVGGRGMGAFSVTDAVATRSLLRQPVGERRPTPRVGTIHFMKVVVYSHDADTRARIQLAIGRRPAPDVPEAEIIPVATEPALIRLLDAGGGDGGLQPGQGRDSRLPAGAAGRRPGGRRLARHLVWCGRRDQSPDRPGPVRGRPGRPDAPAGRAPGRPGRRLSSPGEGAAVDPTAPRPAAPPGLSWRALIGALIRGETL